MKVQQKENLNPDIQETKNSIQGLKDLRMFKRYQVILMHLKGRTYAEIADVVGCNEQTVYNYVQLIELTD